MDELLEDNFEGSRRYGLKSQRSTIPFEDSQKVNQSLPIIPAFAHVKLAEMLGAGRRSLLPCRGDIVDGFLWILV
jgi:hypothetical protein